MPLNDLPGESHLAKRTKALKQLTPGSFEEKYSNITGWVQDSWIEIGPTDWTRSFIRVLDEGGMVWEGATEYESVDDALADAERAIEAWHTGRSRYGSATN